MKVKAGDDVAKLMSLAYKANRPVLLEGPHGVGKSQLIEQAAEELKIDCIVRDLSLMEPPDLIGLPTAKNGKTVYAPPSFLPTNGKGLLVFEELNRSERYMMSPCLQLLTARCLNDYTLPVGWLPVAAINPAAEGYDAHELDPALESRFIRVQVTADVKAWLAWADANGVHASVRQYVQSVPKIFDTTNPRSWTYVSDLLSVHGKAKTTDRRTLLAAVSGLVGESHAKAFLRMNGGKGSKSSVSAEDVFRKYGSVRRTVQAWTEEKRTDLLASLTHEVQVELQNSDRCDQVAKSKAMQKRLKDFISDLPGDLGKKVQRAAKQGGALS